jgi:uncharacterized protein (DUF2147 family)
MNIQRLDPEKVFMKLAFIFAVSLISSTVCFALEFPEVLGKWQTSGNSSNIEIYPCGENLCGKVVWLKHPNFVNASDGPVGTAKIDLKNPDPTMRKRPIIGLQVIEGLISVGNNSWESGKCYDPESGNTYRCKMHLASPGRLEMRGYIGIPLFGRTYVLTR